MILNFSFNYFLNCLTVILGVIYAITSVFWIFYFAQDIRTQKQNIENRKKSQTVSGRNRYLDADDIAKIQSCRIRIVRNCFCIAIVSLEVAGMALVAVKDEISIITHPEKNESIYSNKEIIRCFNDTYLEPAFLACFLLSPQLVAMLTYYLSRVLNTDRVEMGHIWRLISLWIFSSIFTFITRATPIFQSIHYPGLLLLIVFTTIVNGYYFRKLSLVLRWRFNDSALHFNTNMHRQHGRELVHYRRATRLYAIGLLLLILLTMNRTGISISDTILRSNVESEIHHIASEVNSHLEMVHLVLSTIALLYVSVLYLSVICVYARARMSSQKKQEAIRENVQLLLGKYHHTYKHKYYA